MIYNSPFFSNSYYRRTLNRNKYPFTNNYPVTYYNNYYRPKDSSTIKNNNESKQRIEKKVENKEKETSENEIFEIFGIKLHFDDILLICLIFFLYNEGVKDQYLFISLILLLLT